MADQLNLKGSLEFGAGSCASSCASGDRTTKTLAFACGCGRTFQSAVETPVPLQIQTLGVVGAAWDDLDVLGDLTAIEFLFARSSAGMLLRIGASQAILTAVGGLYPTTFVGAETLNVTIDGVAVAVVFQAGDQTAAQCAARINAACALAGLATPRATVRTDGQLQIDGVLTGTDHAVVVTGGTGAARLGLAGLSAEGAGSDIPLNGVLVIEFGTKNTTPAPPARIQVSGVGTLSLVAAGTTT